MILTYEYRALPSMRQHRVLTALLESQRLLYNAALEERIGAYRHAVRRTYFDQTKAVTEWRQSDTEARSVSVRLQHWTLKRVDEAFKGFFRRAAKRQGKAGFPRFRSMSRWKTLGIGDHQGFRFTGRRLRFKGLTGGLRLHIHRPLPEGGQIRRFTLSRDSKGWKVGLGIEVQLDAPRRGNRGVGVDLGISTFAALSDGGFIPSLRAARRAERRLRVAHRALSRKKGGSNRRAKARRELSRSYAAVTRARSNHIHQASARLVRDYDIIAVEALNVRGLASSFLSRAVLDASWARFLSMLRYKAERAGARLIEVDPINSTQECSRCGVLVAKTLDDRRHQCPSCGLSIDRDLNAARNILGRAGVGPGLHNVAG